MSHDIDALLARVAGDPGGLEFPLAAELLRRAGRVEEALVIAAAGLEADPSRLEGRAAVALALLDLGDEDAARRELCEVLVRLPGGEQLAAAEASADEPHGPVASDELDRAFEEAETDADSMVSANDIAERAMEVALADPDDSAGELPSPVEDPAFATETMATLLAKQGDAKGARAIRASLSDGDALDAAQVPADAPAGGEPRGELIATLESWLLNLRRESR